MVAQSSGANWLTPEAVVLSGKAAGATRQKSEAGRLCGIAARGGGRLLVGTARRFHHRGRGHSFRGGAAPGQNASPPHSRDAVLRSVATGGPRRGGNRGPNHLRRSAARLDRETEPPRFDLGDLS